MAGVQVVEVLHRPRQRHCVAAGVAHNALRLTRGARRVEHVQFVRRFDGHGCRTGGGLLHELIKGVFAVLGSRGGGRVFALDLGWDQVALVDDAECRNVLDFVESGIDHGLVFDLPRRFDAAGGRHDGLRLEVVDAHCEFAGGEPAEDNRVDRTNARTGEHCDNRLRDHRHVDDDAVALFDALVLQHFGEPGRGVRQFAVADLLLGVGDGGVVDECGVLTPAGFDVAVKRVVADVEFAVGEPAVQRCARIVERAGGLGVPVDSLCRFEPKGFAVLHCAARGGFVGVFCVCGGHDAPCVWCASR